MAKRPIMTVDRFRIFAETSSESMGPLLAQLTRMGLENIGYELITDIRTFKNAPRAVYEGGTGEEFAMAWIKDNPTFRVRDLAHYFKEKGRPASSAHYIARTLADKKAIRSLGGGNYQSAEVKALGHAKKDKPSPAKPASKRVGKASPRYETPNYDVLLAYIQGRDTLKTAEASRYLEEQGRNAKSASPMISRMASQGLLKLIEPGHYRVLKKAAKTKPIGEPRNDQAGHTARAQQQETPAASDHPNKETVDG